MDKKDLLAYKEYKQNEAEAFFNDVYYILKNNAGYRSDYIGENIETIKEIFEESNTKTFIIFDAFIENMKIYQKLKYSEETIKTIGNAGINLFRKLLKNNRSIFKITSEKLDDFLF